MKMDEIVEYNKKQAQVINDLSHNQKILIDRIGALEQTKTEVNTKEVVNEAVDRIVTQVEKKVTPTTPAPVAVSPEPTTTAPTTPPTEPTPTTTAAKPDVTTDPEVK